jgi:5-methylcytosine-specific restriction protein A
MTLATALRPCLRPGCPELTDRGYCQRHRTTGQSLQLGATVRGYGHRWRELARAYRTRHPVCERPGCTRPSALVHHRDGLGPRGPRGFDVTNLEAICRPCHTAAHRELRRSTR